MNLKTISLAKQSEPEIATIQESDGFLLNKKYSADFRIRKDVYERMIRAQRHLPQGLRFMVFEAYRPLSRQIAMWDSVVSEMKKKHPELPENELEDLCETFVANPYDGIGSGHQACCAVDISLCKTDGSQLDMGTEIVEFNELTRTDAKGISKIAQENRAVLKRALEAEGLINYPSEWWHYSYGDHQWAWLTNKTEAIYGPLSNLS